MSALARQQIVPAAQDLFDAIVSHLRGALGALDEETRQRALAAVRCLQAFPGMPAAYSGVEPVQLAPTLRSPMAATRKSSVRRAREAGLNATSPRKRARYAARMQILCSSCIARVVHMSAGGQIRTARAYRSTRAEAEASETSPPWRMPTSRSQASLQRKPVQQTPPVEQNAPAHAVPQTLAQRTCGEPAEAESPALEATQVEERGPWHVVRAELPLKSALRTSSSPVGAALIFRTHQNLQACMCLDSWRMRHASRARCVSPV